MRGTGLVLIGGLMLLSQLHLYQHELWPDEFGFSTTSHTLDHMKNEIPAGGGAGIAAEPDTKERGVTTKKP